ncbi:MAG: hypothetical protein IIX86_00540, partial [Clostridia bacterium]|nr:hypothetical protein [Clostridia bacterium]
MPQERAITYFGYAEILAPTAVFVWVLRIKATAQTLVGAISDRQHLQQLSIKAIKDCIKTIQSLIFAPIYRYSCIPIGQSCVKTCKKTSR